MLPRRDNLARFLVIVLPVALFVAAVVYYLADKERKDAEEALGKVATATIAALDRHISSDVDVLTALATSPDLDTGNIAVFIERSQRVVPVHPGWSSIALTDEDHVLASTSTGVVTPPRPLLGPESVREVFRTGRPSVSGVFPPTERTHEPYYIVRVPVIRNGAVHYTLSAAVRAWRLHEVLRQLPVPDGGRIGFLDRDGKVLARSNSLAPSDSLIGNLPSRSVLEGVMRGKDTLFRATPVDGDPVYMAARRHDVTGWTAVISAPVAVLDGPGERILALAGGGALAALGLTVAVGFAMVRSAARRAEAERRVAVLEAEAAKRQAESLLAKVMETLPVGVFIVDAQGLVLETNPEGRRIWGGAPQVNIDGYEEYKGWHRNTGTPIRKHEWAAARALLKGEIVLKEVVDIESFDGERKTISISALPLADDRGHAVAAVAVMEDITEQIRVQDALRNSNARMQAAVAQAEEAQAEAERANVSKSKFLAAASHDLRQPVQSLFFFLSALGSHVKPGGEKTLAHATEALGALKSLLDSLLDISRLDAGAVEPETQEFPVSALLSQIDAEFKPLADAKGLHWHVVGSTATVRSDPALLGRMLRNLVQNAIRYTDTGSVLLTCRAVGDTLRIETQDTGIGIPADKLDTIFEEFQQVGNQHRDRSQGLGLGLAIVRRLAVLLGHQVEVQSTVGEGSRFTVSLPMTVAPAPRRAEAEIIPIAQGSGRLVVVIDDEELVRLGIVSLIASWGYDVLDAASGPKALEAVRASRRVPDLIVSDYRLPDGKSGIDTIRDIRSLLGQRIRSVLLTGETTRECAQEALAEDVTVVHKPVSPSDLRAVLSLDHDGHDDARDKQT